MKKELSPESFSSGKLAHEKQIEEIKKAIEHLKLKQESNSLFADEIKKLEEKLKLLEGQTYSKLSSWERVAISRHPKRPHTVDYITNMCDEFEELFGDRAVGDDHSIVGGLAKIGGMKCVIIGQEKGNDTESRVYRNFGMTHPEGFRKALRLMKLAEKFHLPIITFLDTPGAYPGLDAEKRGQGWVIANNLREMPRIQTPIIVIVIGEGCSGGALGIGVGDVIAMLEHSYYTVISPEGCASILYKDASKKDKAAQSLRLNAEDLLSFGVIDHIIKEPEGGAHNDPEKMSLLLKEFLLHQWNILKQIPIDSLLEQRYQKIRSIGSFIDKKEGKEV